MGSRATWPDVLCYRNPDEKNTSGAARSARSASKKPGDFSDAPLLKGCAFLMLKNSVSHGDLFFRWDSSRIPEFS